MSCYHPLKFFVVGTNENGKRDGHVRPWSTISYRDKSGRYSSDYIEIPCGKCIGCRLKYSRDWADRCIMEMPYHKSSFFVTLTYDDEHLNFNDYVNYETGEVGQSPTLVPDDVSKFIKNLRRHLDYHFPHHPDISFFACGEYGTITHRPHYHLIIFGLELQDLEFYKKSKLGFSYYNSNLLSHIWQKGYVVVADCNWLTCAYVARYILKKQSGPKSKIYELYNFEPEFCRMSRNPAIGKRFFEDHWQELYSNDFVSISTGEGGRRVRPNKYFDKLYEKLDPGEYLSYKNNRSDFAKVSKDLKLARTDKSYLQLLQAEEDNLTERLSRLPRKEI